MLWQVTLAVVVVVWLLVLGWKGRKIREAARQFKSDLPTLPLLGHAHYFLGSNEERMSVVKLFGKQAIEYGGWSKMKLGNTLFALVADPIDIDHVTKTHLNKHEIFEDLGHRLVGNGLIIAPAPIWRRRRKILVPAFNPRNLKQFVDVFYQQSCVLVDNLSQKAGKGTFPFGMHAMLYSLDSIFWTSFGSSFNFQKGKADEFVKHLLEFNLITGNRIFRPWVHNDTCFKYLNYFGEYSRITKSIEYIHEFISKTIKDCIAIKNEKQGNSARDNSEHDNIVAFRPFLNVLLEESERGGSRYTDHELREEFLVTLSAGTDTSATAICFTLMMLARHPHIQDKAYDEIQETFGGSDRPIKWEDHKQLVYLNAVIKESLRMHPIGPVSARKVIKDDVTPSGIKLVAGMGIAIGFYATCYNPKYWGPDVDVFRPERFFDGYPTHPSAFLAFSAGPRNCPGYKYAMYSMTTAVATVLRRYRILRSELDNPEKPITITFEVTMKNPDDFPLKLEHRRQIT